MWGGGGGGGRHRGSGEILHSIFTAFPYFGQLPSVRTEPTLLHLQHTATISS